MRETIVRYKAKDGKVLALYKWESEHKEHLKGVIQLIHGSCEHSGRYREFGEFLVSNGYIVYSNDHRGHGLTATNKDELGFFAKENGWERLVEDVFEINNLIKQEYSNLPVFMLGHSMGSFIARHYAILYGESINGLILSGTAHNNRLLLKFAIFISNINIKVNGSKHRSKVINYLSYGAFNRKVSNHRTSFDWICTNERIVTEYINDPLCGYIFTNNAFREMFRGLYYITNKKNIRKTPISLPILMLSGELDVVGNEGKMVAKVYNEYKINNMKDIRIKLYKRMRHEILNEIGKEEVYNDILNWLNNHYNILSLD